MAMSDRGSGETEWTDALQQIISNPQASTQVALDYCNGEMANCLKVTDEQAARITKLERREALLTAVARAWLRVEAIDEYMPFAEAQRRYDEEDKAIAALTEAGFTADGWVER